MSEGERIRHEENQKAIREILEDPTLPPRFHRILSANPEQLTEAEVKTRIMLVVKQRRKREVKASPRPVLTQPAYLLPKRERLTMQALEHRQQRQILQGKTAIAE